MAWFHNMSIRKKIQLIHVFIILPSIVLLTVTLYQMTLSQVEKRALHSSEQKLELITNTVGTLFNDIENFSKLSMINKTYQSVLMKSTESSELQRLDDVQTMYASLNTLVESNPYIDSVVILPAEGDQIYNSDNMSNVTPQSVRVYPKEQLIDAKGAAVWIETFESLFLVNDRHKNLLSIGRRIININDGQLMGYIYINIDERKLAKIYSSDDAESKIMLVNADGKILSSNDPNLLYQSSNAMYGTILGGADGAVIVKYGKQNILAATKLLDKKSGWRAVYAVPTKELMKDQWKITLFILGFGIVGLLLAIILSSIFSNWITRPIMQLSRVMTAVGDGRLDTRAPVGSGDEVGRLARKFNEMVGRIQDLMHAVSREEKQKRELELRLSYSQIKPHFLYNTLEMIRSMALMMQAHDIGKVVKSLGDFYRMSINRGQELIPVTQERKHLESYLYIQKFRYRHIEYRIDFDSRIEGCRIPNMLLQPLVENAIYHGLRDKQEGALCEITGRIEEKEGAQAICFTVKDNGNGMNAEKLERIWRNDRMLPGLSSFGIGNVQERIRLRYGPPFGLSIISGPGEGVEVQLRIPIAFENSELEEEAAVHAS